VYPQADGTAPGTQNNNKNPRAKQDKNAKNFTAKQNKQPNTSFSAACLAPDRFNGVIGTSELVP
jgi:hypothetical protein